MSAVPPPERSRSRAPAPALEPGFVFEGTVLEDETFAGQVAAGGLFDNCRLVRVDLSRTKLRRVRIVDAELEHIEADGADWLWSHVARTTIRDSRLLGIQLGGAELREVTFENCRLDMASFRQIDAAGLEFHDCSLRDSELNEAKIRASGFFGCELQGADFTNAHFHDVDLRGSGLAIARGHAGLRGAIIDTVQLIDLAPALAAEMGIIVQDRP
jgi:uncharacterized protein YjbI with pentapeptide repeats